MGFYQPPQFGSNKPKFTGPTPSGVAPPPPFSNYDDLVGYYQFNETSGNLLDKCSLTPSTECAGKVFTSSGVTYGNVGIIDEAMGYDGIDDQNQNTAFTELNQITNMSWNIWLYQTTLSVREQFFASGIDNATSFQAHTWSDGFIYAEMTNGKVGRIDYSAEVSAQTWFMFTLVYDGGGVTNQDKIRMYLDGVFFPETHFGSSYLATTFDTDTWTVGDGNKLDNNWDGRIDELSIWTRSLSDSEVTELYNGGAGLSLY